MNRKTIGILILVVFVLPVASGMVFGGIHSFFHNHHIVLKNGLDEARRERQIEKQRLQEEASKIEELGNHGTSIISGARKITVGIASYSDVLTLEFQYHFERTLIENDKCWMQKYSELSADSILVLSPALLVFIFLFSTFSTNKEEAEEDNEAEEPTKT